MHPCPQGLSSSISPAARGKKRDPRNEVVIFDCSLLCSERFFPLRSGFHHSTKAKSLFDL